MSADAATARDEILGLFKTAWDATGIPVLWADRQGGATSLGSYATISLAATGGAVNPLTHGTGLGKFEREGLVSVSVFTQAGGGLQTSDDLAELILDIFEGKSTDSGVWFTGVSVSEFGPDPVNGRFRIDGIATFHYHEFKTF